jgi:hypothetical protein
VIITCGYISLVLRTSQRRVGSCGVRLSASTATNNRQFPSLNATRRKNLRFSSGWTTRVYPEGIFPRCVDPSVHALERFFDHDNNRQSPLSNPGRRSTVGVSDGWGGEDGNRRAFILRSKSRPALTSSLVGAVL